jgi:OPA family glycerol-3-phosphate transporter-like MFS transporter
MFKFLKPVPFKPSVADEKVDAEYVRLRRNVFIGIFIGYAGYYLVRKNISLAIPYLQELGYSKSQLGLALSAVGVSYGFSKFLMGNFSDRSNPRYFMALGLCLSSFIMLVMGFFPFATSSLVMICSLLLLNGWVQGMGLPPCYRTVAHWFSHEERGRAVAWWNISHNIGAGLVGPLFAWSMISFGDWRSVFYVPAALALLVVVVILIFLRDTPQSEGLPPIELYKDDTVLTYENHDEEEFTAKEIFFSHVFNNKWLWIIAIANIFVYMVRYGVGDWAPAYLKEVKGFDIKDTGWAFMAYEYGAIPGTILCGWVSDRLFQGRRGPAGVIFMIGVTLSLLVYWLNPPGNPKIDIIALAVIGFLVYGPVMLIGLHAIDLVPKKAAGTAGGFTGLFGYFIGTSIGANIGLGWVMDTYGWDVSFMVLLGACVLAIFFLALTWNQGSSKHLKETK